MEQDTIAAIATPFGSGGIGIIKISGKDAFKIISALFQRSGTNTNNCDTLTLPSGSHLKSPRIFYGHILNPATRRVVDEVLVTMMPGPRSYTREDIVEINTHSGPVVMAEVLTLVLEQGGRIARPGEFTKRAFLNGRIDLTQAEAVIDIIEAKTRQALELAAKQVQGVLGKAIGNVLQELQQILMEIEANIDFPEDVPDTVNADNLCFKLRDQVLTPLKELLRQYETGRFIKNGIRTLIVGKPNVGKSSLMNCLLKKDRVIVSHVPGTTRDFIEEEHRVDSVPIVLVDTAGLHKTADPVENIGIKKTYEYIEQADLILFVIDISTAISKDDFEIYEKIRLKKHLMVLNKTDLVDEKTPDRLPAGWPHESAIRTSALYGRGIEELEKAILNTAMGEPQTEPAESTIVLNLRHKQAIENSVRFVEDAIAGIREGVYPELVAADLNEGMTYLEDVLGVNVKGDILDKIFENFCIGK